MDNTIVSAKVLRGEGWIEKRRGAVSKRNWSNRELRVIWNAIKRRHGNGPRAQTRALQAMVAIRCATVEERVKMRKEGVR